MSTDTTYRIDSSSSSDTFAVGERFGKRCRGGEIFLLASDLGGGKTTFTKGLAHGLGSTDTVGSPTFTVNRVYECRDGLRLYHFDFYRLNEGGMVAYELAEYLDDPKAIMVIEWGDVVTDVLPPRRVTVQIERSIKGEDERVLTVTVPPELSYIGEAGA